MENNCFVDNVSIKCGVHVRGRWRRVAIHVLGHKPLTKGRKTKRQRKRAFDFQALLRTTQMGKNGQKMDAYVCTYVVGRGRRFPFKYGWKHHAGGANFFIRVAVRKQMQFFVVQTCFRFRHTAKLEMKLTNVKGRDGEQQIVIYPSSRTHAPWPNAK